MPVKKTLKPALSKLHNLKFTFTKKLKLKLGKFQVSSVQSSFQSCSHNLSTITWDKIKDLSETRRLEQHAEKGTKDQVWSLTQIAISMEKVNCWLPAGESVTPHQGGPFFPATQRSGVLPNQRLNRWGFAESKALYRYKNLCRSLAPFRKPQPRLLCVALRCLGSTKTQVHYFRTPLLVYIF